MTTFGWVLFAGNLVLGVVTGSLFNFAVAAFLGATLFLTKT